MPSAALQSRSSPVRHRRQDAVVADRSIQDSAPAVRARLAAAVPVANCEIPSRRQLSFPLPLSARASPKPIQYVRPLLPPDCIAHSYGTIPSQFLARSGFPTACVFPPPFFLLLSQCRESHCP